MSRTKKQDAWVAHIRVCVPIDAADVGSISRAQQRVREIANLIPGSTVEVTHAGFGRMAVGAMTPAERHQSEMAARASQAADQPEIPTFLRRNGTGPSPGSPLDPPGDGSLRGPDGAA